MTSILLFLLAVPTLQAGQHHLFTFSGNSNDSELFGQSLAGLGDVDQDGVPDLAVGAYHANDVAGNIVGGVEVFSGRTGQVLLAFLGPQTSPYVSDFGFAVAGTGDVNQDGFADLVVGAPRFGPGGTVFGKVYVFSGRDGSFLQESVGAGVYDKFGYDVSGAGDVDGDGFPDWIAGAPETSSVPVTVPNGYARVHSGKDGTTLHIFAGIVIANAAEFGRSVHGAGDVDADGFADVIVGSNLANHARVFSGKDGSVLHTFSGAPIWVDPSTGARIIERLGFEVMGGSDLNGDGSADPVVAASPVATPACWGCPLPAPPPPFLRAYSGTDGSILMSLEIPGAPDFALDQGGDFDGDGTADLLVGKAAQKMVSVVSGKDGSILLELAGNNPNAYFGSVVAHLGDLTADGAPDFVARQGDPPFENLPDVAIVLSGAPLELVSNQHIVSMYAGGAQTLSLASPRHPSHVYWILGSASGTQPGVSVGSIHLPLNPDIYSGFTLAHPNQPPLFQTLGWLDATGAALAKLVIPPSSSASLAGVTLYHAYLVIAPFGPRIESASNAVPLTLAP